MLPFEVQFKPGVPVSEQVVFAVKRAVIYGYLKPKDRFPSVRQISQELKINPNTAQKVVTLLVNEGILCVHPGVGTMVAVPPEGSRQDKTQLLTEEVERLVVEAKKLGVSFSEVEKSLKKHWSMG